MARTSRNWKHGEAKSIVPTSTATRPARSALVLTCTLLIDLPDASLRRARDAIHRVAARHILLAACFSPTHQFVPNRDQDDMLFKRGYGARFLDLFPDLDVVQYGFPWRRASSFDDVNYGLLRKS